MRMLSHRASPGSRVQAGKLPQGLEPVMGLRIISTLRRTIKLLMYVRRPYSVSGIFPFQSAGNVTGSNKRCTPYPQYLLFSTANMRKIAASRVRACD
jgi:hypothetical protein